MKKMLFILLLLVLLLSATGLPAVAQKDGSGRAADRIDDIENEVRLLLERVSPSLVKVVAENGRKYVATGIALEGGMVVTSTEVLRRPFARLSVETTRGEAIAARLAGQDKRSGLALLRLDKKALTPLAPAKPGEVGNWVALVGLFYDRFPAIFQGIISSAGENELILNAPIAPGAAGGAVVNKKGELLGIIRGSVGFSFAPDLTFKDHSASIVVSGSRSESGSLCYAIPAAQVQRIAQRLKTAGKTVPGWLGIMFVGDTNLVQDTNKGSPAAKAGIAGGDRVVKLAGRPVANWHDIVSALAFRFAGEKIDVTVSRAQKALNLEVVLGDRGLAVAPEPPPPPDAELAGLPALAEKLAELPDLSELGTVLPRVRNFVIELSGTRQLGIDVMEITSELGLKFAVKEGHGLLVSRVAEGSAAAKAGMKAGDVLIRAGDGPLRAATDLRRALDALKDGEAVLLTLYRDGQQRKFSVVPAKNERQGWDVRHFSEKIESLRDTISDEALAAYQDEVRKLLQAKEKAQSEVQKERFQSLKKVQEESQRLARELQRLQQEKDRLAAGAGKKYAEELKLIQEELRRIQERIRSEAEAGAPEKDGGR